MYAACKPTREDEGEQGGRVRVKAVAGLGSPASKGHAGAIYKRALEFAQFFLPFLCSRGLG